MDDCLLPPVLLEGRFLRPSGRASDGARDNELGESSLTPPLPFPFLFLFPCSFSFSLGTGAASKGVFFPELDDAEIIWEFRISGVSGAGECEGVF